MKRFEAIKFIRERIGCSLQEAAQIYNGLKDQITRDKREEFAAMAMQGILASDTKQQGSAETIARMAIETADSLINRLTDLDPSGGA